jgi:putative ABC transport system ATP-binding protein
VTVAELVRATGICKSYGSQAVLCGVDLTACREELVSISGVSGSGKSTLLSVLGLLDTLDAGEYLLAGRDMGREKHRAFFRNKHIGFVFQLYHLLPSLTVLQNILVPAVYGGKIDGARVGELSRQLGIAQLLLKRADVLSGGEKQRVALARAMILKPDLILADEPTGALDEMNSASVMQLFRAYAQTGKCVIMVTHSRAYASLADTRYRLEGGAVYAASG